MISIGKPKGSFAVEAGGRRLRALKTLTSEGRIAKTHQVDCLVVEGGAADAKEASLAENFQQLAMNPGSFQRKDRCPMTIKRIKIDARKVRRAAAALSSEEHEVLRLSAAHGLSNDEIGSRLGLSNDEVVRVLAGALSKFGRALERQERPWWRSSTQPQGGTVLIPGAPG